MARVWNASLVRGDVADWPFSPFPPPHPPPLPLPARSPHPFPPPFRSPLISLRFPPTPRVHPSSRAPTSLPRFPPPPPDPLLSPPTPPPQHTVWLTSHPLPTPCLPSSLTRSSSLPLSTLRSPRSPRPRLVFPLTHPSFLPTIHPYYLPVPLALPSSFYSLTPHFSPPIHPYYLPVPPGLPSSFPSLTPHFSPPIHPYHLTYISQVSPSHPLTIHLSFTLRSPLISPHVPPSSTPHLLALLQPLSADAPHSPQPPSHVTLILPVPCSFSPLNNVNHLCYTFFSSINQCQPSTFCHSTTFPLPFSALLPHKHLPWAPSLPLCAPPRSSVGLLVTFLYPQHLSPQAT
ncbi:unnamed protein product [Closterium sp. Naga37s-1]|nr:unnamed protein product [Closterium sp. Naga37s-1]